MAPTDTLETLRGIADEVIAIETPAWLVAIGEHYEDFSQTSDDEIASLLAQATSRERVRSLSCRDRKHERCTPQGH